MQVKDIYITSLYIQVVDPSAKSTAHFEDLVKNHFVIFPAIQ